jgi:predicted ATPase
MAAPPLTSIEIDGFTSIQSAEVELGRLNVLVGANGSGKSNFIQVFELLGRIVDENIGLYIGVHGGASALLNASGQRRIRIQVNTPRNSYEAVLVPTARDELVFERERLHPGPFDDGTSNMSPVGSGYRETKLGESPALAGADELLRGCRVFHFHDASLDAPVTRQVSTADNLSLRADAGNLAAMLLSFRSSQDTKDQAAYRQIVGAIRLVAPFFDDFVLQPEPGTDYVRLRWREKSSDAVFFASQMSDGTLRFVCLTTLLLQPRLPALVVLDETELGLHPYAIVQLAGLLRQASTRSQVVIATQSVTLMNQFDIEDLIVVERDDTGSKFRRPNPQRLRAWLADYSLGELWEKNLIGGQPGSTGSVTDV